MASEARRTRKVTYGQLEALWEALNKNRSLATGFNKTSQARESSKRMWETVAENLNSFGDGAIKDWKSWCKYWNDYKSKLKQRVAAARASHQRTGGGPSNERSLTEIEEKFLQLLGVGFGSGLPGIRVEPFEGIPLSVGADIETETGSESILAQFGSFDEIRPSSQPGPSGTHHDIPVLSIVLPVSTPPRNPEPHFVLRSPRRSPCLTPRQVSPNRTPPQRTPNTLQRTPHNTPSRAPCRVTGPQRWIRRRDPPLTMEAARRLLVASVQSREQISLRTVAALEQLVVEVKELKEAIVTRFLKKYYTDFDTYLKIPSFFEVDLK